jgi:hypothetical protein
MGVLVGEVHDAKAPVSIAHSNVDPAWDDANANSGRRSRVVPDGPPVMVVFGATVSTVQFRIAGVLSMRVPFLALTRNV